MEPFMPATSKETSMPLGCRLLRLQRRPCDQRWHHSAQIWISSPDLLAGEARINPKNRNQIFARRIYAAWHRKNERCYETEMGRGAPVSLGWHFRNNVCSGAAAGAVHLLGPVRFYLRRGAGMRA